MWGFCCFGLCHCVTGLSDCYVSRPRSVNVFKGRNIHIKTSRPLKLTTLPYLEESWTTYPLTQRHIPDESNPLQINFSQRWLATVEECVYTDYARWTLRVIAFVVTVGQCSLDPTPSLCFCRTNDSVWYWSYGYCSDVSSVSVFDLACDPKVSSQQYETCSLGYVFCPKGLSSDSRSVIYNFFSFSVNIRIWSKECVLGAFVKLRRATVSFVVSVCPSVRMEQFGSHWIVFHEMWYLFIFSKICREN